MPILVAPRPPTPPIIAPLVAPLFTWTSSAGRMTELSQFGGNTSGIMVPPGAIGLGMPEYTLFETESPGFDGSSIRGVRAGPRSISLPLHIWGATRDDCLALFHRLVADMNPRKGLGTLSLTARNGVARSIGGYYAGGMEGADDDQAWRTASSDATITAVVSLKCPSPYFEGDAVTQTFQIVAGGTFLPILPLAVSDSQVLGAITITNAGDAETFPVFTIEGPADSITLTNSTTGQTIEIGYALLTGDTLVINCREAAKSVVLNGSTNLYPELSLNSALWPIVEGANAIDLELPGATADSSLTVAYRERFLTCY